MRPNRRVFEFAVELIFSFEFGLALCPYCAAQQREVQRDDCSRSAGLPVPSYHLAREWRGDIKPLLVLFISVNTRDVNQDGLVALACAVGKKYAAEQNLSAWILDNSHAAKIYNPAHEGNTAEAERSLRATYGFSRKDHSQTLDWRPDPKQPNKWIHIDLGRPPAPANR